MATDAAQPGILEGVNYLWYRAWGYSDDEAVVAAYEDFYDMELSEQQQASAYSALSDNTSVIEDAAASMLESAENVASSVADVAGSVAGSAGGSFASTFTGAAGPVGTLAAVAAVAALGYVAFKAAT